MSWKLHNYMEPCMYQILQLNFVFRTKLVDGTEVIQEVHAKPKTNYSSTGQGLFIFS